MFELQMPVSVLGGPGAVLEHANRLAEFGPRAFLVTGRKSADASGAYVDVVAALIQNNIAFDRYDQITQNPRIRSCRNAADQARHFDASCIIGIGGGSALDAAKVVAALVQNPQISDAELFAAQFAKPPLPILLVGTTAGTGSEVTATSVLTIDATGMKKSVSHPSLYAKIAFADPKYTYTLSYEFTVSTALDAFSHAAEGYFSPRATGVSDLFAEQAMEMLYQAFVQIQKDRYTIKNHALRETLYDASLYAGMTLGACGTAFCHPLGYILTERYGLPHGKACTVFFPALLERAAAYAPEKANRLFERLDCSHSRLISLIAELTDVTHIHMTQNEIAGYRKRLTGLKNYANTPGGFDETLAMDTLRSLFLS